MTDTTDEPLFAEATEEIQNDIVESLNEVENKLPESDQIWKVEGSNVVGTLNSLQAVLDVSSVEESYREARKWFVVGVKADAFDDETEQDLENQLDQVGSLLVQAGEIRDIVGDLTPMLPELRDSLDAINDKGASSVSSGESDDVVVDSDGRPSDADEKETNQGDDVGDQEGLGGSESWGKGDS